jgi:hypothetical protein
MLADDGVKRKLLDIEREGITQLLPPTSNMLRDLDT